MNYPHKLVEAFAQTFSQGGSFKTINHARQLAQAILGENIASGTPLAKLVDFGGNIATILYVGLNTGQTHA